MGDVLRRLNHYDTRTKPEEKAQLSETTIQFVVTLAYGNLSTLELASLQQSNILDFKLLAHSDLAVLIECESETASALISRLGGSYKLARVCGTTIDDLLDHLPLPDDPKFAWTISGYGVSSEMLEEIKQSVRSFLKEMSLGKSRYVLPDVDSQNRSSHDDSGHVQELKLKNLSEKVLRTSNNRDGIDIVAVADLIKGHTLFGYTIKASDYVGFEKRDFSRSYQNPTMTIGPRLARVLVNLAMKKSGGSLLDPFCGLGTILQEALVLGYDVCGVDISASKLERCRANLNWLKTDFDISEKRRRMLIRGDASNLNKEKLPKISGVATEPILLPIFASNPTGAEGTAAIYKASHVYRETFESLHNLVEAGTRMVFVVPAIVDSAGREHGIHLDQIVNESHYQLFKPELISLQKSYPLRVHSSRKKIIQRDVYVMEAI